MSFTLGRASLPSDPQRASWSGDQLTISGWINPTTANDTNHAYALRQQLLGLMNNPDEQVFPCTFSVDPNWDGYYYVNSVSVNGEPGLMEIQGRMQYSVTLTRLAAGFARPLLEILVQSVLRTNAHGVTVPNGVVAAWGTQGAYADEFDGRGALGTSTAWTSADGAALFCGWAAPQAAIAASWFVRPTDYYRATCKIEVKYGSTWYAVTGQQIPDAVGVNWRISNGLTRLYPTQVSGTGRFTIERYTGGQWVGREFTLWSGSGAAALAATTNASGVALSVKVLSNHPDVCTIRTRNATTVDFTLRSGASFVEISTIINNPTSTLKIGAATSAVVAMTAFTGGARATANDANGLRALITQPVAVTTDLVNGIVYPTAFANTSVMAISPDYQTNLFGVADTSTRDMFLNLSPTRRNVVPR